MEERSYYIYGTCDLLSCAIPGDYVSDIADIPKVRVRRLEGYCMNVGSPTTSCLSAIEYLKIASPISK